MAITHRPYEMPEATLEVAAKLNDRYDRVIGPFCKALSEYPHRYPGLRLSITNRCNLRCAYCYDRWRQPPAQPPLDMTPGLVREVFRRYPEPKTVFVLGGEPFLNLPALEAVLEFGPRRLAISTNGHFLDGRILDLLARVRSLNEAGRATILQVSCDLGGASSARGSTDAPRLERNLLSIAEHASPFVKAKYTMTEADVPRIRSIVEWYWARRVPVQLDYADSGHDQANSLTLSPAGQVEVYETMRELLSEGFAAFLRDDRDDWTLCRVRTLTNHAFAAALTSIRSGLPIISACGLLGNSLYVGPAGALTPCHRWTDPELPYGTLGDDVSPMQTTFHREATPRMIAGCAGCVWRGMCGWVCPAVSLLHGWAALDARCRFLGALRDAVWAFLTAPQVMSHPWIDRYLERIEVATPM